MFWAELFLSLGLQTLDLGIKIEWFVHVHKFSTLCYLCTVKTL